MFCFAERRGGKNAAGKGARRGNGAGGFLPLTDPPPCTGVRHRRFGPHGNIHYPESIAANLSIHPVCQHGAIYFQERKYDKAVPELRQAVKLKPSLAKASTLLSIALSETGNYKEAIPGLEKGFALGSDAQVKRMCGLQLLRAYSGLHQDEKAVRTALELGHLYGQDPEVLYHTGRIYGNFAYLTMKKLGAVAPDSVWRNEAAGEAYQSQGA